MPGRERGRADATRCTCGKFKWRRKKSPGGRVAVAAAWTHESDFPCFRRRIGSDSLRPGPLCWQNNSRRWPSTRARHNLVSLSCDQRKLPLVAAVRKNRRKVKICSVSLAPVLPLPLPLRMDGLGARDRGPRRREAASLCSAATRMCGGS